MGPLPPAPTVPLPPTTIPVEPPEIDEVPPEAVPLPAESPTGDIGKSGCGFSEQAEPSNAARSHLCQRGRIGAIVS
jgi:hypothetical protein